MNIGVVFTLGMSVAQWEKQGLLEREKILYERLLSDPVIQRIYWFTYGANDDAYQSHLAQGLFIVPMPTKFDSRFGRLLYSFLMPWVRMNDFAVVDVVKTNQLKGAWTSLLVGWLLHLPVIVRGGYLWSVFAKRGGYPGWLDRLAALSERICFRRAHAGVVTTPAQRDYVATTYKVDPDKLYVIPNYVDTTTFAPQNTSPKANRLLYVGRLEAQKNLDSLIRALANTSYGLDIYGTGTLQPQLKDLAKELGVSVEFHGNVPHHELPGILNQFPVFVLPSYYEGFPKTLLEAMSAGRPTLVTDVEGSREITVGGETSQLVETSPESLRKGVITLMADPSLQTRLGKGARDHVMAHYSLDTVVQLELKLLKSFAS